jgi:cell division protein FtsI (penicillin-binding protein 3)
MKVREKKWIRFRIYLVAAFFLLGLVAITARAYQLQILEKDRLESIARDGYIGTAELPPKRGTIYDRGRHELAISVEATSVYAHPNLVKAKAEAARKLSRILDLKTDQILRQLKSSGSFVWIERRISPNLAGRVKALELKGVGMIPETRRYYPGKETASHLIGFVGTDNQGLEGLEKKFDELLNGPRYRYIFMRNALGKPFFISRPHPSDHRMHDLVLTIDKDIQYKAQQALKSAVRKTRARSGQCLVVDPETGEVLAMAVVPEFNPNVFNKFQPYQWRNRIATDSFEPGSTIKAFLLAAALEESVVTPQTEFDCEEGKYTIGTHVIHDTHEHGIMSVSDIIVQSSNIGAVKIGERLGYETFYRYLKNLGFGERTGEEFLGEREGFIRSPEMATPIDQANLFFGQGMTATSLQLAMAVGAIANGGNLMRPYVVKLIEDESGSVVKRNRPSVVRRVFSSKTARKVSRILEGVVGEKGTGPEAAIRGFRVAGKTGTAQKVDGETKRYSTERFVSTFMGFVPADNPRLVIVVVIDEPKGIPYGGLVAAPVFREVGLWSLNYLRVNPRPNVRAWLANEVTHTRETSNRPASAALKRISLNIQEGFLPDFTGLGMREVIKKAETLGVEVLLEGTGLAVKQHPQPGLPLNKVHMVKVNFRPPT